MKKENKFFKFIRITAGLLILFLGLSQIMSIFNDDSKEKIKYVPYSYGDIIKRENTTEGEKFKLADGIEIIFEDQVILSKDDIEKANQFNDASSDVALLKITFNNNSDEDFNYNIFGIEYSSTDNVQLDPLSGMLLELPDEYKSYDDLSSGTVKPGNTVSKIRTIAVPDGEKVKTIYWDYFGDEFTVELP